MKEEQQGQQPENRPETLALALSIYIQYRSSSRCIGESKSILLLSMNLHVDSMCTYQAGKKRTSTFQNLKEGPNNPIRQPLSIII